MVADVTKWLSAWTLQLVSTGLVFQLHCYLISLWFSISTYKVGMIILPTSQDCCEDYRHLFIYIKKNTEEWVAHSNRCAGQPVLVTIIEHRCLGPTFCKNIPLLHPISIQTPVPAIWSSLLSFLSIDFPPFPCSFGSDVLFHTCFPVIVLCPQMQPSDFLITILKILSDQL